MPQSRTGIRRSTTDLSGRFRCVRRKYINDYSMCTGPDCCRSVTCDNRSVRRCNCLEPAEHVKFTNIFSKQSNTQVCSQRPMPQHQAVGIPKLLITGISSLITILSCPLTDCKVSFLPHRCDPAELPCATSLVFVSRPESVLDDTKHSIYRISPTRTMR